MELTQFYTPDISTPLGAPVPLEEMDTPRKIQHYARKNRIPWDLAYRLVHKESGGNRWATSPAGAMGLAQLMPATAQRLGVTDPYDPDQNLDAGFRLLRQLYDRFGNWGAALAGYNAGEGRVRSGVWADPKHPKFEQTRDYLRKILGDDLGNRIITQARKRVTHPYQWPDYGGVAAGRALPERPSVIPVEFTADPVFWRSGYEDGLHRAMLPLQAFVEGMRTRERTLWETMVSPLFDMLGLSKEYSESGLTKPWEEEWLQIQRRRREQGLPLSQVVFNSRHLPFGAETDWWGDLEPLGAEIKPFIPGLLDLQYGYRRQYGGPQVEAPFLHELRAIGQMGVSEFLGGLPEAVLGEMGVALPEIFTPGGAFLGGAARAAGFVAGPGKVAAHLLHKLPLTGSRWLPHKLELSALLRTIGDQSATMALAMPLANLVHNLQTSTGGEELFRSILNDARLGAMIGILYPSVGFLAENRAVRFVAAAVLADMVRSFPHQYSSLDDLFNGMLHGTLPPREIALRVSHLLIDGWFGVHQLTRGNAVLRERMGRFSGDMLGIPQKDFFEAQQAIGKTRDLAAGLDYFEAIPLAKWGEELRGYDLRHNRLMAQAAEGKIDTGDLTGFFYELITLNASLPPDLQGPYTNAILGAARVSSQRGEVLEALGSVYKEMRADLESRVKEVEARPPAPSPVLPEVEIKIAEREYTAWGGALRRSEFHLEKDGKIRLNETETKGEQQKVSEDMYLKMKDGKIVYTSDKETALKVGSLEEAHKLLIQLGFEENLLSPKPPTPIPALPGAEEKPVIQWEELKPSIKPVPQVMKAVVLKPLIEGTAGKPEIDAALSEVGRFIRKPIFHFDEVSANDWFHILKYIALEINERPELQDVSVIVIGHGEGQGATWKFHKTGENIQEYVNRILPAGEKAFVMACEDNLRRDAAIGEGGIVISTPSLLKAGEKPGLELPEISRKRVLGGWAALKGLLGETRFVRGKWSSTSMEIMDIQNRVRVMVQGFKRAPAEDFTQVGTYEPTGRVRTEYDAHGRKVAVQEFGGKTGQTYRVNLIDHYQWEKSFPEEPKPRGDFFVDKDSRLFKEDLGKPMGLDEYFNALLRHPEVLNSLPQLAGKTVGFKLNKNQRQKLEVACAIASLPPRQFQTLLDYSRQWHEPGKVETPGPVRSGPEGQPGFSFFQPIKTLEIKDRTFRFGRVLKDTGLTAARELRLACTVPDSQFGKWFGVYLISGMGQKHADLKYITERLDGLIVQGMDYSQDEFLRFAGAVETGDYSKLAPWEIEAVEVYARQNKTFAQELPAVMPKLRGPLLDFYLRQMYARTKEGDLQLARGFPGVLKSLGIEPVLDADGKPSVLMTWFKADPETKEAIVNALEQNPGWMSYLRSRFEKRSKQQAEDYEKQLKQEEEKIRAGVDIDLEPVKASDFTHDTSFLEARHIPDYRTAILLGLLPRHTNPIMLMRQDLLQKARWMMEARIVSFAVKEGMVQPADFRLVRDILARNPDKVRLEGRAAQMFESIYADLEPRIREVLGEQEVEVPRAFVAHEHVAALLNRMFSATWWESPTYVRGRRYIDFVRKLQVGFSLFHLTFETMNLVCQGTGEGLVEALGALMDPYPQAAEARVEKFNKGLKRAGKALLMVPEVKDVVSRSRDQLKLFYENPEIAPYVQEYVKAGGRLPDMEMIKPFAEAMTEALSRIWFGQKGKHLGPFGKVVESIAWGIMGYYVPMVKLGGWLKMREIIRHEIDAKYGALPQGPDNDTLREREYLWELQKAAEHMDNIHGQMVYDNLPLNRWIRDAAFLAINYPGWQLGSYRWMYFAAKGMWKSAIDVLKGDGLYTFKNDAQAKHAMTYAMGMLVQMAVYNTLWNLFMTGEAPDWRDILIGPRTGRILSNGAPERLRLAGYHREVLEAAVIAKYGLYLPDWKPVEAVKELATVMGSKEMFALRWLTELARNTDYFGNEIVNPEANFVRQGWHLGKFFGKSLIPFSIRPVFGGPGMARSPLVRYGGMVGISRVPKRLSGNEMTELMDRYFETHGARVLLEEDEPRREVRGEVMDLMDSGDINGARQAMASALMNGTLTTRQYMTLQKDIQIHMGDPLYGDLRVRFNKVKDLDYAIRIYQLGDKVEKNTLRPLLVRKWGNASAENKRKNASAYYEAIKE